MKNKDIAAVITRVTGVNKGIRIEKRDGFTLLNIQELHLIPAEKQASLMVALKAEFPEARFSFT